MEIKIHQETELHNLVDNINKPLSKIPEAVTISTTDKTKDNKHISLRIVRKITLFTS